MMNKNLNKSLDKIMKLLDTRYTTRDFYYDDVKNLRDFVNSKFLYTNDSVIIPSNVKEISDGELSCDNNAVNYVYLGTKAEWDLMNKGQSVLEIPCIHCLDGLYIQRL